MRGGDRNIRTVAHFCLEIIIVEWFGLEGTLKDHLVQPPLPCHYTNK